MNVTLDQTLHLLTILRNEMDKKIDERDPYNRLKDLFDSGILFDVLEISSPMAINREVFRKAVGLPPLPQREAFNVEVNFEQNTINVLQEVLWNFLYDYNDYPTTANFYSGKGQVLFVPVGWKPITKVSEEWRKKGFVLAGFRETLIAAITTQKPGVYVCPIPVLVSARGPAFDGTDDKYWMIYRSRHGEMYLLLYELAPPKFTSTSDSFLLRADDEPIMVKKRDIFVAMLRPQP